MALFDHWESGECPLMRETYRGEVEGGRGHSPWTMPTDFIAAFSSASV
jgi:hypothetical protein